MRRPYHVSDQLVQLGLSDVHMHARGKKEVLNQGNHIIAKALESMLLCTTGKSSPIGSTRKKKSEIGKTVAEREAMGT